MKTITQLPPGYQERRTLDLSQDFRLLVLLQAAGGAALLFFGWLVLQYTYWLRPEAAQVFRLFETPAAGEGAVTISLSSHLIFSLVIALVLMVILHEAIHGFFFWLFTRRRPRFGFKLMYAYAASPEGTYLSRDLYMIVAAAPLVVITVVGLLLIPVVPLVALPLLVMLVIGNAAGAVGDVYVLGWLLREPPEALLIDHGERMTSYGPPA